MATFLSTAPRFSDEWWLEYLVNQLNERNRGHAWVRDAVEVDPGSFPGTNLLWDYFRGEPNLPQCATGWQGAMREFLRMSRMNYAGDAIRSIAERMAPLGWYTAVDSDADGDELAAEIAGTNEFETTLGDVIEDMLWSSTGFQIVSKPERARIPIITAEDPRACIVQRDGSGHEVMAGLKLARDDWDAGSVFAHLHLPGRVRVARRDVMGRWEWQDDRSGPTGSQRVTMIDYRNKSGVGEFERHLDVLDRINDGILMRVTIAKYQAFRQRAVKLPAKDEDGNEVDYQGVFTADPGAMWQVPPDTDFWESGTVDLAGIRAAIKDDVAEFLHVVGAPPRLSTDAVNVSATGSDNAMSGNLFRALDRQRRINNGLARALALSFELMGDQQRAQAWKIQTIWSPVEMYSITDKASAGAQYVQAGVPYDEMMVDVFQKSPADLKRIKAQRATDLLFQAPPAPAVTGG